MGNFISNSIVLSRLPDKEKALSEYVLNEGMNKH
jgi:hypothetical protein